MFAHKARPIDNDLKQMRTLFATFIVNDPFWRNVTLSVEARAQAWRVFVEHIAKENGYEQKWINEMLLKGSGS